IHLRDIRIDPVLLFEWILKRNTNNNKPINCAELIYVYPIQMTCYSKTEDIIQTFKLLKEKYWNKNYNIHENNTWAIVYKRRLSNDNLNKEIIIQEIGKLVTNKCNLTNPDVTVLIQTWLNIAGVSIIPNNLFHK